MISSTDYLENIDFSAKIKLTFLLLDVADRTKYKRIKKETDKYVVPFISHEYWKITD